MKQARALGVVFILILFVGVVTAYAATFGTVKRQYFTSNADVVVAWDFDNATSPDVTGFKLYTAPATTPTNVTTTPITGRGTRTFTWAAFPNGQFIAYMTSVDRYGNESDPSDTIQVNKSTTKPPAPTNNKVNNAFVVINMP
jgi:hypothetical protein